MLYLYVYVFIQKKENKPSFPFSRSQGGNTAVDIHECSDTTDATSCRLTHLSVNLTLNVFIFLWISPLNFSTHVTGTDRQGDYWCVCFVSECRFGGKSYELEQTWNPDLGSPFGVMYCVHCECVPVSLEKYPLLERLCPCVCVSHHLIISDLNI